MLFFEGFSVVILSNISFVTFMLSFDNHHFRTPITTTGNTKIDLIICSPKRILSVVVSETVDSYH